MASPDSTNLIINDINKSSDTAYKDIILELLHLNAPFYINNILRDPVGYKIDIFIRYDNKSTFTSPCCRIDNCKIHSKNPRVWRTLDTLNYKTFIHLDVPKIKCPKCGKLCYYEVEWARKGCGLTYIFEQKAVALCTTMSMKAVSAILDETDVRIAQCVQRAVEKARENLDWSNVKRLGLDEKSRAKHHKYISVFVDMDTYEVLYVTEGKDASVLDDFAKEFIKFNGRPSSITDIAIDMSPAFISGVNRVFMNAEITFDKFHIMKLANEAVDNVRREEVKTNPILIGTRYYWLHNVENLTENQRNELTKISKRNLKTARAYRYKLALQEVFKTIKSEDAEIELKKLISWGLKSRIIPIINFAKMLKTHFNGIKRYFISRLTSGAVEGINSRIQELKSRARGYTNVEHFKNMIYLTMSNLTIPMLFGPGEPIIDISILH